MAAPATETPQRRWWLWIAAAALVICGALTGLFFWWRPIYASAQIRSVAVVPASGSGPEWLAEGVAAEVVESLARFPELRVGGLHPESKLSVAANLDGERLSAEVRLVRIADDYELWHTTFHGRGEDASSLPGKIAASLAKRVDVRRAGGAADEKPKTASAPAFEAFLEGRASMVNPSADSCTRAEDRLRAATEAAPEYSPAWAWFTIAVECRVENGQERPNAAMPGARDAAERGVALDPNSAVAHLALGIVNLQYDWDWAAAKEQLDRAYELSPGSALVLRWRSRWFQTQGRADDVRAESERAATLDALSAAAPASSVFGAAESAARNGDKTEAEAILNRAIDLRSERYVPASAFAGLAAALKDWDEVFDWLEAEYDERSVQLPYARLIPGIPQSDPRFQDLMQRMSLPGS